VGAAGLESAWAALEAGKDIALANKETLVLGGSLVTGLARERGAKLLPVDSEHSALFQLLQEPGALARVERLILTGSGGPFRGKTHAELRDVTIEQALNHPTWKMGPKITIDSATLMNKGLEVIEAKWLFGLTPEQIGVVVHPQSIIHSMVVCRDHSVLAQLGTPDMRVPIAYGLSFPERIESGAAQLDFLTLSALSFAPADRQRFPCLYLAWDALRGPEGSTTVLNAANEVAVEAFLAERTGYLDIHRINAATVEAVLPQLPAEPALDDLLALDAAARAHARSLVQGLSR